MSNTVDANENDPAFDKGGDDEEEDPLKVNL